MCGSRFGCVLSWLFMTIILAPGFQRYPFLRSLPSGKLTWQWKMDLLKMHSLFENRMFHCHVGWIPELIVPLLSNFNGANRSLAPSESLEASMKNCGCCGGCFRPIFVRGKLFAFFFGGGGWYNTGKISGCVCKCNVNTPHPTLPHHLLGRWHNVAAKHLKHHSHLRRPARTNPT